MTTAIDVQKSIQDRLNLKLKETIIDLIPPEMLEEQSQRALNYFLHGRTQFQYDSERKNYNIYHDPDTLVGLVYAALKEKGTQIVKEEVDKLSGGTFHGFRKTVNDELLRYLSDNSGVIFANMMGSLMQSVLQQVSMSMQNNANRMY